MASFHQPAPRGARRTGSTAAALTADAATVLAWANSAAPGEALMYFRGHLAMAADTSPAAEQLARAVAQLHRQGLVAPVQQRLGQHDYKYVLQRTCRPAADLAA